MELTILQDTPPCQASPMIPLYTGDLEADVAKITTVKQAKAIVGGLSKPSKMPSYAYNLPASRCKTGAKLKEIPGSVCYGCYAADTIEWTKRKCEANGKWLVTVDGLCQSLGCKRAIGKIAQDLTGESVVLQMGKNRGLRYGDSIRGLHRG